MPDLDSSPDVPCPGCGRGYPAERFRFGRTFRCTCGERVGRASRPGRLAGAGEPRFLADVMLGRLARWLRALGYDAAWEAEIGDAELVRRGVEERRLILTRDRGLAEDWWVDGILLIGSDRPLDQLREVAAAVELSLGSVFTRCTHCNRALEPAPAEAVRERVPAPVREQQTDFRACPECRRVFWPGGHVRRMRRALEEALEG
jgi:uncharacterized protein with PIN domain